MESEKITEKYLCDKIRLLGGEAYKFTSPNRRNVPDRICVLPKGFLLFVEVKSEGKLPSDGQKREINRLLEKGQHVAVVTTKADVDLVINKIKEAMKQYE
jgi:hypothetical protein